MPDIFVAVVAMVLGLVLVATSVGRASWLRRSPMAMRLEHSGGQIAARLIIGALGGLMIFIGVSLLRK